MFSHDASGKDSVAGRLTYLRAAYCRLSLNQRCAEQPEQRRWGNVVFMRYSTVITFNA